MEDFANCLGPRGLQQASILSLCFLSSGAPFADRHWKPRTFDHLPEQVQAGHSAIRTKNCHGPILSRRFRRQHGWRRDDQHCQALGGGAGAELHQEWGQLQCNHTRIDSSFTGGLAILFPCGAMHTTLHRHEGVQTPLELGQVPLQPARGCSLTLRQHHSVGDSVNHRHTLCLSLGRWTGLGFGHQRAGTLQFRSSSSRDREFRSSQAWAEHWTAPPTFSQKSLLALQSGGLGCTINLGLHLDAIQSGDKEHCDPGDLGFCNVICGDHAAKHVGSAAHRV